MVDPNSSDDVHTWEKVAFFECQTISDLLCTAAAGS